MNKIVSLYLARRDVPTRMDVVQGSVEPAITFILEDYTPANGAQAQIFIKKKESEVFNTCTISGNQVTFKPTTGSFDEAGLCVGQLQIISSGKVVISYRLFIKVEPNIIDGEAIEASDDFSALEDALMVVGDITQIKAKTDNITFANGTMTVPTNIFMSNNYSSLSGVDSTGYTFPYIKYNGNLWIGARERASQHYTGRTFISTGYDATNGKGYPTIIVAVPNANNDGADVYDLYHSGNLTNATTSSAGLMSSADKTKVNLLSIQSPISYVNLGDGTSTDSVTIWGNSTNKVAVGVGNTTDGKRYAIRATSSYLHLRNETDSTNVWTVYPSAYMPGEEVAFSNTSLFAGRVTNSTKSIDFQIPLPRSAVGRTCTLTLNASNGLTVRGANGFANSTQYIDTTTSAYTVTATPNNSGVYVRVTKSTAFTNVDNETNITATISGTLTFS